MSSPSQTIIQPSAGDGENPANQFRKYLETQSRKVKDRRSETLQSIASQTLTGTQHGGFVPTSGQYNSDDPLSYMSTDPNQSQITYQPDILSFPYIPQQHRDLLTGQHSEFEVNVNTTLGLSASALSINPNDADTNDLTPMATPSRPLTAFRPESSIAGVQGLTQNQTQPQKVYLHSGLYPDNPPGSDSDSGSGEHGVTQIIYPQSYDITISAKYPGNLVDPSHQMVNSPYCTRTYSGVSMENTAMIESYLRESHGSKNEC
ncbi:hypothetical protein L486_03862 [Kwoniella mangroviensis CBS 10435]|uniref:Uncharacterized protein n=1 Tax=Kwoniella mangroviensis CBS 10435 TaxID=1331196 RepID=A0A1B9IUY9_9TREE|nr:hypothetical protein L486_03862 [Kwoniella mangroviensis CBS 10435]